MKSPLIKSGDFGKKAKLLPSKQGLKTLGQSQRTLMDYSKQVPTNPVNDPNPLLVDLMRVRSQ